MLGARDLSIAWQDDTRYWEWGCIAETRSLSNFSFLDMRVDVRISLFNVF